MMDTWTTILHFFERSVLFTLIGLSVWSMAIIIDRYRTMKAIDRTDGNLSEAKDLIRAAKWAQLEQWAQTRKGPRAGTLLASIETVSHGEESVDRAVKSFLTDERTKMEKGITVLATLGSNAPFIGLFGTVLGIIQAFAGLSDQSGTEKVMAGISEALIATAAGLFVAIPAVVAYNIFNRKMRIVFTECESLKEFYLSRFHPVKNAQNLNHNKTENPKWQAM